MGNACTRQPKKKNANKSIDIDNTKASKYQVCVSGSAEAKEARKVIGNFKFQIIRIVSIVVQNYCETQL